MPGSGELESRRRAFAVAAGAAQRGHALALHVLGSVAHRGGFGLDLGDQVLAMSVLALRPLRLEAQGLAQVALAIADHDLLDLQSISDGAVAPCARKHLPGQRVPSAQRHAPELLAATGGQGLEVGRQDHARVAHEQAAPELPVASRASQA